ncbi:MAG: hypothetical protein V3U84_02865 [Thiotrichaceae bacterium]
MIISRRLLFLLTLLIILVLSVVIARQALTAKQGGFLLTEVIIERRANGEIKEKITAYPVLGINYKSGLRYSTTKEGGKFKYRKGKNILFSIGDLVIGVTAGATEITQASFKGIRSKNLAALLFALDEDGYRQNGIQITTNSIPQSGLDIDLTLPVDEFASILTKKLTQQGQFTLNLGEDTKLPVTGLDFISGIEVGKTSDDGVFTYQQNKKVTFRINDINIDTIRGELALSTKNFPEPIRSNLRQYLLSIDEDTEIKNGIQLANLAEAFVIDFSLSREQFEMALTRALNRQDRQPVPIFSPSLGINIEAAQAEADTVGQPMPFVDIFRTARPFHEFSEDGVTYDIDGWPTFIPEGKKVYTLILQSLPVGAIPYGKYTVLYDGIGTLAYDGVAKRTDFSANKDIIDIRPENSTVNRLILRITETSKDDPIRNIRIIMPGGTCEGMPFLRVNNEEDCAIGQYRAFVDMLEDRNTIVFNPDYLRFLKNFRVLRLMNFMETSQHIPRSCYKFKDDDYRDCVLQPMTWNQRTKMSDAVWGGSHRTDETEKHGVPIEVLVKLANTVHADPWFNLPHNADDEYIEEFADYVYAELDHNLKAWVEYSNETWNDRFWGAYYVRYKGRFLELDADKNPFREGFRYYSKRAVEIFKIWEDSFDGTGRLIRVAGSYQNSIDLSRNILEYEGAHEFIDALAIAPYFHACSSRQHRDCKNLLNIPTLLPDVKTVDEVFEALQNPSDPYGIPAAIKLIRDQAELSRQYSVDLVAYEGGEHLAVNWSDEEHTDKQKQNLSKLFVKANEDPRMGELYLELLNSWKTEGGTVFNLFNMPQTWHRWGSWGIKTHLNQPREEAPKYDAIISFQEQQEKCWWDRC